MNQKVSIIGLGVMGQRMLGNMHNYAGFDAVTAWDPDQEACERTVAGYPGLEIAADASAAIGHPDTSVVYIASPPVAHSAHARAAFDAGKAVYCEKPLGVDLSDSESLVAAAADSGLVNIVNFSLASATATREIERLMAAGALGEIVAADVRIHFATWPRAWQMAAASWLSYRAEGGFTREVLSHWIYLSERLLGPLSLDSHSARYPGGNLSETHLHAMLFAGETPVSVAASSGGIGPDLVEYTLWGSKRSCRIVDWNRLFTSDGDDWRPELTTIADHREAGYELQLQNAARATAGEDHSMPTFADALAVQRLIEAMLI